MFPTQITVQWHVRNGESRIWHCCQCCKWLLPNKMFAKDGLFKMPQWNTQACSCISIVEQQSTTHMWLSKSNLKMVAWLLMEMMTFRNEVRKWSHIETGHFSSEIMNLGKMNAWHNAQKNWVCNFCGHANSKRFATTPSPTWMGQTQCHEQKDQTFPCYFQEPEKKLANSFVKDWLSTQWNNQHIKRTRKNLSHFDLRSLDKHLGEVLNDNTSCLFFPTSAP